MKKHFLFNYLISDRNIKKGGAIFFPLFLLLTLFILITNFLIFIDREDRPLEEPFSVSSLGLSEFADNTLSSSGNEYERGNSSISATFQELSSTKITLIKIK